MGRNVAATQEPAAAAKTAKVLPLIEDDVLEVYADRLAAPGALHAGIAYFRAHRVDAEHNREHAKTKLPMPALTVGGTASFGADLEGEVRPLVSHMRAVTIEDCGHYLAEEQPQRLVHELLSFFREVPEA